MHHSILILLCLLQNQDRNLLIISVSAFLIYTLNVSICFRLFSFSFMCSAYIPFRIARSFTPHLSISISKPYNLSHPPFSLYHTSLFFPTTFSLFPCCRRRRPIYSLRCFCSLIFRSQNKPVASPKHSWPGWRGPVHLAAGGRCGCRCAKRSVPKSLTVHGITTLLFSSWNVNTHFPLPQVFS